MEKEKIVNLLKQVELAIESDIETCKTEIKKAEDGSNSTAQSLYIGKKAGLELALSYVSIVLIDTIKGEY